MLPRRSAPDLRELPAAAGPGCPRGPAPSRRLPAARAAISRCPPGPEDGRNWRPLHFFLFPEVRLCPKVSAALLILFCHPGGS